MTSSSGGCSASHGYGVRACVIAAAAGALRTNEGEARDTIVLKRIIPSTAFYSSV